MSHQVVAVHAVHMTVTPGVAKTDRTKATKPEVKIMKPGTSFVIDDEDEYDRLKAKGAVRDWGSEAKPLQINDVPIPQVDAGLAKSDEDKAPKGRAGKRVSTRSKKGGEKGGSDADEGEAVI